VTRVLALDLETVPDAVMAQRLWGITPGAEDFGAQVAAARRAETDGRSDFPKPGFHRIVAVGLAGLDTDTGRVKLEARADTDEGRLVATVEAALARRPTLVTWNGGGFDLPVLRARALVEGVPLAALYGPAGQKSYDSYLYRYGDQHVDLMDVLGGYGASAPLKLVEAATLCGLPAKTQGEGAQVLEWFLAGDGARIERYVLEDAVLTLRLWLRWQETMGRLGIERRVFLDGKVCTTYEPEAVLT